MFKCVRYCGKVRPSCVEIYFDYVWAFWMLQMYKSDPLKSPRDISLSSITLNCVCMCVNMYFQNTHKRTWSRGNGLIIPAYFGYTYSPSSHSLLLHCQSPSLPTVLRDRIWIHKPVSIEVPNIISWPTLPYCSRWLQKGKPHCCGAGKGKLQEGM